MRLIKLQFGGLIENGDEDGTFTCILEEKGNFKRKLFLQLTREEGRSLSNYIKQNETKMVGFQNPLFEFVNSGYIVNSTRIAIRDKQQIGIVNIKRGRERLQVALNICIAIILMKNFNVATSIEAKTLNYLKKQYTTTIECKEKGKTKISENILNDVDECIYSENYGKIRCYVEFVRKMINRRK